MKAMIDKEGYLLIEKTNSKNNAALIALLHVFVEIGALYLENLYEQKLRLKDTALFYVIKLLLIARK